MTGAHLHAFDVIKMRHLEATYGHEFVLDAVVKAVQDPRVEQMRAFVIANMHSSDPTLRAQAEDVYRQLTALMSQAGGSGGISRATPLGVDSARAQAPEGMQSVGAPRGEAPAPTPFAKAFQAFAEAEFLRKNVVGMQDGTEYNMPPAIASMAQRPQVPEMMQQTMETRAPGLMGRFKAPVMQTAQIPTGQASVGGPQTMDVQPNLPHAMGMGTGPAPGARVERMPRPGPYSGKDSYEPAYRDHSFSTYSTTLSGNYAPSEDGRSPIGPKEGHYYQNDSQRAGTPNMFGVTSQQLAQDAYGDQFNPNRQF